MGVIEKLALRPILLLRICRNPTSCNNVQPGYSTCVLFTASSFSIHLRCRKRYGAHLAAM